MTDTKATRGRKAAPRVAVRPPGRPSVFQLAIPDERRWVLMLIQIEQTRRSIGSAAPL